MPPPGHSPGVKEAHQPPRSWIEPREVRAFVLIAAVAREGEIRCVRRTAVLASDHVLDVEGDHQSQGLRQQAVLTAPACAAPHRATERLIHQRLRGFAMSLRALDCSMETRSMARTKASYSRRSSRVSWLRTTSPRLSQNTRRYDGSTPALQRSSVQGPEIPSIGFRSEQRPRVVGQPVQESYRLLRVPLRRRSTASAARSSASASAPCSASHSATAASPSSTAKALSAALLSHAERLSPRRPALAEARSAMPSSSATDSFLTPIGTMVAPDSYRVQEAVEEQHVSRPLARWRPRIRSRTAFTSPVGAITKWSRRSSLAQRNFVIACLSSVDACP